MTDQELEDSYQARKALVGKIAAADGKFYVGNQLISIDHLSAVNYITGTIVRERYASTKTYTIGVEDIANTAYAVQPQGKVVVILSTKLRKRVGRSSLYTQSLIGPELIRDNTLDQYAVVAEGLSIFLDKNGKYIPPRKIDVIAVYPELLNELEGEEQIYQLNNVLKWCNNYDIVLLDGGVNNVPGVLYNSARQQPGLIRCLFSSF